MKIKSSDIFIDIDLEQYQELIYVNYLYRRLALFLKDRNPKEQYFVTDLEYTSINQQEIEEISKFGIITGNVDNTVSRLLVLSDDLEDPQTAYNSAMNKYNNYIVENYDDLEPTHYVVLTPDILQINKIDEFMSDKYPNIQTLNLVKSQSKVNVRADITNKLDIAPLLEKTNTAFNSKISEYGECCSHAVNLIKEEIMKGNYKYIYCSNISYDFVYTYVATEIFLTMGVIPLSSNYNNLASQISDSLFNISNKSIYDISNMFNHMPLILKESDSLKIETFYGITDKFLNLPITYTTYDSLLQNDMDPFITKTLSINDIEVLDLYDELDLYETDKSQFIINMNEAKKKLNLIYESLPIKGLVTILNTVLFRFKESDNLYIGVVNKDLIDLSIHTNAYIMGLTNIKKKLDTKTLMKTYPAYLTADDITARKIIKSCIIKSKSDKIISFDTLSVPVNLINNDSIPKLKFTNKIKMDTINYPVDSINRMEIKGTYPSHLLNIKLMPDTALQLLKVISKNTGINPSIITKDNSLIYTDSKGNYYLGITQPDEKIVKYLNSDKLTENKVHLDITDFATYKGMSVQQMFSNEPYIKSWLNFILMNTGCRSTRKLSNIIINDIGLDLYQKFCDIFGGANPLLQGGLKVW